MVYANNMKQHRAFIGLITILFWAAFAFNGCATQAEQSTSDAVVTAVVSEPSPTAVVATAAPVAATATATAAPTITPPVASPTPTPTMVAPTATATAIAITPNPGWAWYEESEAPGVLFQLPQTWDVRTFRPKRFQAPETNSFIEVRAFDFSGSDWLAWVQHESQPGYSLADGFVKQNGLVKGRPSFLFLEGGGGANAIELYIRDEARIVNIYFHSGVARLEAEMQILLTMIETLQFAAGGEGETTIPPGWVQGRMLTIYSPERLEFTRALQTISGTVETVESSPSQEITITDAEGASYRVDLRSYYGLESLPVPLRPFPATLSLRDVMQPGLSVTLSGYQTSDDRFYPLWGQTTGAGDETVLLYRPSFDLHRFDPTILAQYPASAPLYLRGPWEQVQPYLVGQPDNSLSDDVLALDPAQDVIVRGTLQSTAPPRLTVEEFYYLDGGCEMMTSDVQQCKYYQPVEIEESE